MNYKLQTNSKDFGAFRWKQYLFVEIVQHGEIVGVYVDAIENLSNCCYAPAGGALHFQLFALNDVFARKMG